MMARILLFALLVLAPASRALADDAAEARFHDERARAFFSEREFERAIEEFLWSHRIAPNPRALFNVALCFDAMDDAENALSYFAEYLELEDRVDGAETRRAQARAALERLTPRVARLRIESDPPGATIFIDNLDHGAYGETPRTVAITEGDHRITLRREGYEDVVVEARALVGASTDVRATLRRQTGTLRIDATATVAIHIASADGTWTADGEAPGEFMLPPGTYAISGGDDTREVVGQVATVRADAATELTLTLIERPGPRGELTVTANDAGALVFLDDEPAGFTPALLPDTPAGRHALRVEREGRDPWEGEVEVHDDQRTWVTATLRDDAIHRSPWAFGVGGVGAAALLSLAVITPVAARNHRDFERLELTDPMGAVEARQRGRALNHAGNGLLGTGIATFGVGLTLFFTLDARDAPSSASVTVQAR